MARDIKTKDGALNLFDKTFILALVENGGNVSAAAKSAGYKGSNAHSKGMTVMRRSGVSALIRSATQDMLGGTMVLEALATIRTLSTDAASEQVRLRASEVILDKAGLRSEDRAQATVGSVVINLNYQVKSDGTHEQGTTEKAGLQKQGGTVTHTPQPFTGDEENVDDAEYVDIEEMKEQ